MVDDDKIVRAITKVYGEDVVVAGGRFEKISERRDGPTIVIRYPAGKKRFDGRTGLDSQAQWRIHPDDLQRIQLLFPEKFRPILARDSIPAKSDMVDHVHLVGRSFVPPGLFFRSSGSSESEPRRTLVVTLSPPALADLDEDDVTMRRLIALARRERWDVLEVTFLFSRALKNAVDLKHDPNPIGPDHDRILAERARLAERVVVAWGSTMTFGKRQPENIRGRDRDVLDILRDAGHPSVWSFRDPRDPYGQAPLHPQRVAFDMPLSPWTPDSDRANRIRWWPTT